MEPVKLDEDPVKDRIKMAMLYRKHERFPDAIDVCFYSTAIENNFHFRRYTML